MIFQSSITLKGKTVVPLELRSMLDLKPGDKLRYVTREGNDYPEAKTRRAVELAGMFYEFERTALSVDNRKDAIGAAISSQVINQG